MTTWVFLRGLTRESRHWGDFPERFCAAFAGELAREDILTPDLPGNGRRCAEPSPSTVAAMLEACRSDLRGQGRAPPYHLLALSLGGMVAVAWAARYPEECRAVVLLSTSLRPYNRFHERLLPGAWPIVLRMLVAHGEARERAILELTSARAADRSAVLPDWTAWARECPVARGNAMRQLLAAARFHSPERPTVPLLFLAGAGDRLVDPRCSQRLARAWGAGYALHPSAGHDLALDDGDWVAREVRRWLG
jgi:pimeloyl-ACP methyl ester carboxylesterase